MAGQLLTHSRPTMYPTTPGGYRPDYNSYHDAVRKTMETQDLFSTNVSKPEVHLSKNNTGEPPTKHKCTECPAGTEKIFFQNSEALRYHVQISHRTCNLCNKTVLSSSALKIHMLTHTWDKPHPCTHPGCNRAFTIPANLERHLLLHNRPKKPFPCPKCDKEYCTSLERQIHSYHHNCDQGFSQKSEYASHMLSHTVDRLYKFKTSKLVKNHERRGTQEREIYHCPECLKKYSSIDSLEKHLRKAHPKPGEELEEVAPPPPSPDSDFTTRGKLQKRHICIECGQRLTTAYHLKIHMNMHRRRKRHECSKCPKTFNNLSSLRAHARIHKQRNPYSCEECKVYFTTSTQLRHHNSVFGHNKTCYVCGVCGESFAIKNHYKRHMDKHTHKPLFTCSVCQKGFRDASTFRNHEEAHKTRSHLCPKCKLCFRSAYLLKKHKMQIHDKIKFRCSISTCTMGFKTQAELQEHIKRTHSHVCAYCGKCLKWASELKQHMATHTGDFEFWCSICGQGFSRKNGLAAHMRKHTGGMPYICPHCGQGFRERRSLRYHINTHLLSGKPYVNDGASTGEEDIGNARQRSGEELGANGSETPRNKSKIPNAAIAERKHVNIKRRRNGKNSANGNENPQKAAKAEKQASDKNTSLNSAFCIPTSYSMFGIDDSSGAYSPVYSPVHNTTGEEENDLVKARKTPNNKKECICCIQGFASTDDLNMHLTHGHSTREIAL